MPPGRFIRENRVGPWTAFFEKPVWAVRDVERGKKFD